MRQKGGKWEKERRKKKKETVRERITVSQGQKKSLKNHIFHNIKIISQNYYVLRLRHGAD